MSWEGDVDLERLREFVRVHPDATPVQILGQLGIDPVHRPTVEAVLNGDEPPEEPRSPGSNPGGNADTNVSRTTPPRQERGSGGQQSGSDTESDRSVPPKPSEGIGNINDTEDGVGAGETGDGESGPTECDNDLNRQVWAQEEDEPADSGGGRVKTAPAIDPGIYPEDLKDVPRWLTWKPTDDGRKIPRAPYLNPEWPDKYVSAQEPDVWTDFDTARLWAERLPGYGLAFNIPNPDDVDDDHVLIDYDDARNPDTGEIHPTVRKHIERAGSYADVSTSGTGVHIFARGALPDGVKAIDAPLPHADGFDGAEIEVYDAGRYSAMTGDHIQGTPPRTTDCQAFLDDLADEYTTVAEGTPAELIREPEKSQKELADVETTTDPQDVFDAIQHTGPRDIRLRSTVTHDRGDGSKSMDPSWASSKSGTRLAQIDDGWVYRKGMYGLDALQVVALEDRIITHEGEYPNGADFWKAVDALRSRGAHIPEYQPVEGDVDPVAVLPDTSTLHDTVGGWDWRHASRQDARDAGDQLTIDSARERTQDAIAKAYDRNDRGLIEALPGIGKSHGSVAAAAKTDTPVTILTTRGNKEQYGQYRGWSDEYGLTHYTLPAFFRDCPTANGEHGDDWAENVKDLYKRGATPKEIHTHLDTPCQEDARECPYKAKWRFDPEDYDVLIGHYSHAHNQKVTQGRAVVFDEFPGGAYEQELAHQLPGAVSYFLACHDALPFDDFTDLLENRSDDRRRADALAWFQGHDVERDGFQVFGDQKAHALAPLAVFTILAGPGNDLGNGWERADLGDGRVGAFDRERNRVLILSPPPLQYASGVVALDGTPTKPLWELSLGIYLNHREVLTDDEKVEYIRDVRNLILIRTTDAVKPYNSAGNVNVEQDAALLEGMADAYGKRPAVITTATAEREYDAAGVLEYAQDTAHYGNLLGSNKFGDVRLGAVIGSNHFGDDYIQKWGAYAGEAVEHNRDRETGEGFGAELSYGDFGDDVLTHMREHQTLQALNRFGRDGHGAVVCVHTDTFPDWVPIADEGRVLNTWSDGMRQVIDAAEDLGSWTTAEIAAHPAVDIGQRQVFDHLETLRKRGHLIRDQNPDDGRGYRWTDDGLHRLNEHGDVELEPVVLDDLDDDEVAEVGGVTNYTWEFRNLPPSAPLRISEPCDGAGTVGSLRVDDDPPSAGSGPPLR